MLTATITPKFINPPKVAGRSASIKDTNGVFWGIRENAMALYAAGQPVTVEYIETAPNADGKTYKNIQKIIATPTPAPAANGAAPHTNGNGDQARQIFITGVVGRAMGSGEFSPTDIKSLTLAAADAWATLHAPKPQTQAPHPYAPQSSVGQDLNDEIPW